MTYKIKKDLLDDTIENVAKAVNKIFDKLDKNKDFQAEDILITKLSLLGKLINRLQNTLRQNKRNANLISSLRKVS